ncbi:MAG: hypothetical protein ACOYK7_12025 [Pirellulales bacterium]
MASAATTTHPPPAIRGWRGGDFPDWLSPMLVKELRQGIQSGAFALTFATLHTAVLVLMLFWLGIVSGVPDGGRGAGGVCRSLFWALLGAVLVLALPLRGLNAIRSEEAGQTFDLLRLTRMSSTQIVVGKWVAIMAQVLLVATAVLPYVVLQYFLGGYSVFADLAVVGLLVVAAGFATALAIAISGQTTFFRGLAGFTLPVVMGWGGLIAIVSGSLRLSADLAMTLLVLAAASILTLLEFAAAGIAPPSENHALRKRLLALGFTTVVVCMGAVWAAQRSSGILQVDALIWIQTGLLPLIGLLVLGELLSDTVPRRSLYEPFARWGAVGGLLAALFTPGWATAVPFTVLLMLLLAPCLPLLAPDPGSLEQFASVAVLIAAGLLLPIPFTRLVKGTANRGLVSILVTIASFLPLFYLEQPRISPASPAIPILEVIVACLPFPLLARGGQLTPGATTLIGPLLVTAIVWVPLVAPWLAEMRSLRGMLAACRRLRGDRLPRAADQGT